MKLLDDHRVGDEAGGYSGQLKTLALELLEMREGKEAPPSVPIKQRQQPRNPRIQRLLQTWATRPDPLWPGGLRSSFRLFGATGEQLGSRLCSAAEQEGQGP